MNCDLRSRRSKKLQKKLNDIKPDTKRKGDSNETPTCAVPVNDPQTNAFWREEEEGTTKTLVYT